MPKNPVSREDAFIGGSNFADSSINERDLPEPELPCLS